MRLIEYLCMLSLCVSCSCREAHDRSPPASASGGHRVLRLWTDVGCVALSSEGVVGWSFDDEQDMRWWVLLPAPQEQVVKLMNLIEEHSGHANDADDAVGILAPVAGKKNDNVLWADSQYTKTLIPTLITVTRVELAKAVHAKAKAGWLQRDGNPQDATRSYAYALRYLHEWMRRNPGAECYDGDLLVALGCDQEWGAYDQLWNTITDGQLLVREEVGGIVVEFVSGIGDNIVDGKDLANGEPFSVSPRARELIRGELVTCRSESRLRIRRLLLSGGGVIGHEFRHR